MTERARAAGLGHVIAAQIAEWGGAALPLERIAFGTDEPDAIADAVDTWCRAHLGAAIDHYLFFDSSSGSVHGLHLTDGRDVVVKVHRPGLTFAYLAASHRAQRLLVGHGLPGPRPLVAPIPYGAVHITAEAFLPSGPWADGHDPVARRALAHGLAGFVRVGRTLGLDQDPALEHPMAMPAEQLYPAPHSARFDFAATAAGSEWIDALATRARRVLDAARLDPPVLVHGDWRIENVNVAAGAVVAIYDWDSVCTEPEIFAVANAMVTHSVDWSRPVGEHFPANAAIRSFLTDYETARGETFAADQHLVIAARMVYHLAYGARCEHAISFPEVDDSQQGLLRRLGQPLLTDGLAALDD